MSVEDAVELFYDEMWNNINNSCVDESTKELLFEDLKAVRETVTLTYHAKQKKK